MIGHDPSFVFSFAVNGLLVFTSIANMLYGHKLSYTIRIGGGFTVIGALMIVLPLVTEALSPNSGWAVDLIILVIFGMMGGMVQSSLYGIGGMLPFKYMGGVMFGQGISGITVNLLRALCLLILPPTAEHPQNNYYGALIYFVLAAVILIFCVVGIVVFLKLPIVKYYIDKANHEKMRTHRRISGIHD